MPIIIKDTQFSDLFSYSGTTYKANAGDDMEFELTFSERIRLTSQNNPLSFDPILNILSSPSVSPIDEGFRVNDVVLVTRYDSNGTPIATLGTQISAISDTEINFTTWASNLFYDIGAGDIMVIEIGRRRQDLEILFNHSLNNQPGSTPSLIDGEATRIMFNGAGNLTAGNSMTGSFVGNQSGQFLEIVDLTYNGTDSDSFHEYTLTFNFNQSGVYDSAWFELDDCLKVYVKGFFSSLAGEVFDRVEFAFDNQANTGYFDEANNISISNGSSKLIGITNLNYNENSTNALCMINLGSSSPTDISIGGCYISTDDAYYKNRTESQRNISLLLPTTANLVAGTTYNSNTGVSPNSSAQWSVTINSITNIGTTVIIDLTWSPNTQFQQMMANVDNGDRLFKLWVRCGPINHLVYDKQLSFVAPVGGPLTLSQNYGFLDHSQNVETATGNLTGFVADTEDDVAFYGTFDLDLGVQTYSSINLRLEAFNSVTNDKFTLQQTNFGFGGATYQPSTGKYLWNNSSTINSELPSTSVKRDAKVYLTGNDVGASYEVAVYYPILLNWKYWVALSGVNPDFAPNENQNWEQYDNLPNWEIRMVVELINNGLSYTATNTIVDRQYDAEPDINSSIALKLQSNNQVVSIIPDGEQLFIESTHVKTTGNWNVQRTWGMITIEPKEASPRSICSTIVPFDNNSTNPLEPISGLLCSISYPQPDTAVLKCKFNPGKIDTSNGVKIGAKIKEGCFDILETGKITTSDEQKWTTNDEDKIIA